MKRKRIPIDKHVIAYAEYDIGLTRRYISKYDSSRDRGIEFALTFNEYRNLMRVKRCALSGLEFSKYVDGKPLCGYTARTIDRIDCRKGYVKSNTIVVCNFANQFKAVVDEDDKSPLNIELALKIIGKINKQKLEIDHDEQ